MKAPQRVVALLYYEVEAKKKTGVHTRVNVTLGANGRALWWIGATRSVALQSISSSSSSSRVRNAKEKNIGKAKSRSNNLRVTQVGFNCQKQLYLHVRKRCAEALWD